MNASKRLNAWLGGFGFALLAVGCSDCGGPTEPVNAEIQFVADRTLLENSFNSTSDSKSVWTPRTRKK